MKKLLTAFVAITLLGVVSCRQQDDMISPEDDANLKVMETTTLTSRDADSIEINKKTFLDGDPIPPPRR